MTAVALRSTPVQRWRTGFAGFGLLLFAIGLLTYPPMKVLAIGTVIILAMRWPIERMIVVVMILTFALEEPASQAYAGNWKSPIQDVGEFWFDTLKKSIPFLKVPVAPILVVAVILVVRAANPRSRGMQRALPVPAEIRLAITGSIISICALAAFGVGTGGDVQQVYYQILGLTLAVLLTGIVARISRPALIRAVVNTMLVIAAYRAFVAVWVYLTVVKDLPGEPPLYITTHNDSMIWSMGIALAVARLIEIPSPRNRVVCTAASLLYAFAIVVNNRRLAWVIVFGALAYVVLTTGWRAKRRLAPILRILVPLVALYTLAGIAAPPSRVFAPVQSLMSVATGDDSSSQTRDIEDYNLTTTMKLSFPLPAGFGKEYIEFVQADEIASVFAQYRYLPHNSVLGLMLSVGPVPFALIVLPLLLGMRSAHLLRKDSTNPLLRGQIVITGAAWIAYVNQGWGDLGFSGVIPGVLVGIACGLGVGMHQWHLEGRT